METFVGVEEKEVSVTDQVKEMSKEVTRSLDAITSFNFDLFKTVEKLVNEGASLRDLFFDGRGLNVYGELYPDLPVFNEPIDSATVNALAKKYIAAAKSLNTTKKRIARLEETFKKKMLRRAKTLARMTKGSAQIRKQYIRTIRVEDLEPFKAGDYGEFTNSLSIGRQALIVIQYTENIPLEGESFNVNESVVRALASAVLDHTEALKLATSGKVSRALTLTVRTPPHVHTITSSGNSLYNKQYDPNPGESYVEVRLSYVINVPKKILDPAIDALEELSKSFKAPLYRSDFYDLLGSLSEPVEEEPLPF